MALGRLETGRGIALLGYDSVTITNTNTETVLVSQLIDAGKMGQRKKLMFEQLCVLTTAPISLPTLTIRIKFGGTTVTMLTGATLLANQTNSPFVISGFILNDAANAQRMFAECRQNGNSVLALGNAGTTMIRQNMTIDTTVDQTFQITAQFGGLSSGTTLLTDPASIELS